MPARRGRLIGRDRELIAARQAVLSAEGRLVTLIGGGGCGKTRLALQIAAEFVDHFPDGVWFVELARVAAPSLVPQAITAAMCLHERQGRPPLAALLATLADGQQLLVLDNCEHLIGACAEIVESLLTGCPNVRVLATSRGPLRIDGEVTWRVPSLALPDLRSPPDNWLRCPAVELFVERARAVRPEFAVTARDTEVVGQICTRLAGLPLAIELAAAQVRTLGIEQIAERLQDTFRLLVGGSRTAPPRHQTLRATLDWSHELLSETDQVMFWRTAVFGANWSLEAAEAVCADGAVDCEHVLGSLSKLVDLSLVVVDQPGGRARYRLLEPIRQYALERLVECGEQSATGRRHANFFLALAAQQEPESNVGGPRREAATAVLEREYGNLQSTLRWCLESRESELGLRLARALYFFWGPRTPPSEGLGWLRQLLAMPAEPSAARALALIMAGRLGTQQGNYAEAHAFFEEGLPLARQTGDAWALLEALICVGIDHADRGDYSAGHACFTEAHTLAQAVGDRPNEASCLTNFEWMACLQADYATARSWSETALSAARAAGDGWTANWALTGIGYAALGQQDYTTAQTALQESATTWQQTGELYGLAWTLDGLGQLALAEGKYREAQTRFTECLELRHELGDLPGA